MGQIVCVVGLTEKMFGEDVAGALNGLAERVATIARLEAGRDRLDDFIPGAGCRILSRAALPATMPPAPRWLTLPVFSFKNNASGKFYEICSH